MTTASTEGTRSELTDLVESDEQRQLLGTLSRRQMTPSSAKPWMVSSQAGTRPRSEFSVMQPLKTVDRNIPSLNSQTANSIARRRSGTNQEGERGPIVPDDQAPKRRRSDRHLADWLADTNSSGRIVGALLFASDVTEVKLAEEDLRQLAAELRQRNSDLVRSNQELDSFAYIASHDLKEPLRGIHNYRLLCSKITRRAGRRWARQAR